MGVPFQGDMKLVFGGVILVVLTLGNVYIHLRKLGIPNHLMLGIDVFSLSILGEGEALRFFLRHLSGWEFLTCFYPGLTQHRSPHATTMPGGLLLHGTNNEEFSASLVGWEFFPQWTWGVRDGSVDGATKPIGERWVCFVAKVQGIS